MSDISRSSFVCEFYDVMRQNINIFLIFSTVKDYPSFISRSSFVSILKRVM